MRIIMQNKNQGKHQLYVPNVLLYHCLTSFLLSKVLEKHKFHLTYKQIRMFTKEMKAVHKRHPDLVLLEAEQSSGEKFKIIV